MRGRPVEVIWDRPQGGTIKGVTEHYLQASAPALGRRPGDLERITWEVA
jgi:hypothetical protein